MAYTRRNQSSDIRANRVFTATTTADLPATGSFHGDMAYVDGDAHAYIWSDGAGWLNLSALSTSRLSDYSTGSWTPALKFGGSAIESYTTQVGRYVKMGEHVFILANITINSKGAATGTATITGLPFTTLNVANAYQTLSIPYYQSLNSVSYMVGALVDPNGTGMTLITGSTGSTAVLNDTHFNNGSQLVFSGSYRADA